MVRRRADRCSRSTIVFAARLPRARALPLHDRRAPASRCCCCRACRASASRSTAPTSASSSARSRSSRRSSGRSRSSSSSPPTCATRGRCWCRARGASLGVTIPPLKHFGPLLVVWGAAMFMLVFIRDLGSSLMYFGGFLALLYVATNRLSFVARRARAVRGRRVVLRHHASATSRTASTSGSTRSSPQLVEHEGYQIAQSLFAQADGGLFGTASAQALLDAARRRAADLPAPHTDLIYAVIVNELGLVGRVRAAARLPAVRRARLQDRDARRRLVLEAAGRRA